MFKKIKNPKILIIFLAFGIALCSQQTSFLKVLNIPNTNEEVEKDKTSLETAINLQNTLRNIAKSVSPAVVNIRTEKTVKVQSPFDDFFNDPFFRRFFGEPQEKEQKRKAQSLGTGIIISPDGYIITNNHVVQAAETIIVNLNDKRTFKAKIIGADEKTDIALLKIDAKGVKLPVAPLGDSDKIEVGDFAIAIGNPFGLNWTFTFGVISATGRSNAVDENAPFKSYIQTDVSINPGNSGGPLLNIRGQVIGINSAIYSTSGGSIGIGFAIPINIVKNVVTQLIEKGKVERGYIGIYIQDVDENLAKYYKLDKVEGVIVTDVQAGSPAEKAGLKPGDLIVKVNDKNVEDASSLISMISNTPPGGEVNLKIKRNNQEIDVKIIVGKRSEEVADINRGEPWLGMRFGSLKDYAEKLQISSAVKAGVVVIDIDTESSAYEAGIRPGDVIDMINNTPIKDLDALTSFISKNKDKKQFLLRLIRGNRIYFVAIEN
ncbi:MAG TPA: Do family serine endopeptidase [Spirochaetota bacterium]|mgnify:CR=1 FL=1|nr:Do family serine endopeptidase [Spirochaetota bacterium]HOM39000.1 Do family serine endopeptidase [Spirochaetota bacterium]HPQ49954.1 Do family serine endopeptidase [Spirochaetota bacterium]